MLLACGFNQAAVVVRLNVEFDSSVTKVNGIHHLDFLEFVCAA